MAENKAKIQIYRTLVPSHGKSAVALGIFDGLHLGHQSVISLAVKGTAQGLVPTVLTFSENPKFCGGGQALLTEREKIRLLSGMGVQQLYLLDFNSIKDMTADEFVCNILRGTCRAEKACCGFNYTFGRGGKAGSADLKRLCAENGIAAEIAPAVLADGKPVSSTRIRTLVRGGRMEEAARLLGRPFGYETAVISGRHLGHRLGTPTLNQPVPPEFVQPRFGVYISFVESEGLRQCGVTNVGVKPTVGSDRVLAETWMPAYCGPDLYGRTVRVGLLKFLLPERKFPDLPSLQEEIIRNGREALRYFHLNISSY